MDKQEQLKKIVGDDRVITDPDALKAVKSDSSFVAGDEPGCIVRPQSVDDVQKLVGLANQEGFALIPVSSTGPRSHGDTVPQASGAVIVDLSDMKKIVRIDQRNKVAMVEPGVTFTELQSKVEKQGLRLEMPMMPRKTKSVLASLLDREPTTGPKYNWDANDPLCCLELVFGTGDLFRTGNAAGPGSLEQQWAAGQAQKVSMGPAQTDIGRLVQGSQGTLAIATWATVKLELKPAIRKGFVVSSENISELIDFTYKILWRKIPDLCLLLNRVDLAAITRLPQDGLPKWALVISISGLKHLPEERIAYLKKDLDEIAGDFKLSPSKNLAGMAADDLVDALTRPSDEPYWKRRAKGGCRDLFFLTTLDRAPEFIDAVSRTGVDNEFAEENLGVYIQPIRHGTGCHLEFNLFYDPENPDETERVKTVFEKSGRACLEMGAFFSRPYPEWADMTYAKCPDTAVALKKIKNIFDPHKVMNPGKLCFGKEA